MSILDCSDSYYIPQSLCCFGKAIVKLAGVKENMEMKKLLILFIAVIVFSGCESDNGEDGCTIRVEDDPTFDTLSQFADCPAEGLTMFCNNWVCNFTQDEEFIFQETISPQNCTALDCNNLQCDEEVFDIQEILESSNFAGTFVDVNEQEFDFVCSPVVP